ncbi:MAG: tetratricopeptide repeat protein [Rhodanobacteraceae bacterium]
MAMLKSISFFIAVSLGTVLAVTFIPAKAQSNTQSNVGAAPDYGSGFSAGLMSDANLNTPEAAGRPGWKFFELGSLAFKKGDYSHAIYMFKVASSWAYKPAEYDLGVMYFHGKGVAVNRPLGAAWMVLAAERGNPHYVKSRDVMVTMLSDEQFAEADKLWANMRKTYGDKVALRRAKAQWAFVKSQMTGSRVGGEPGELRVGLGGGAGSFMPAGSGLFFGLGALTPKGSTTGSVAYRQFQQSDNPYSPIFLENRKGSATVGPLQQVKPSHETNIKEKNNPAPSSSDQEQQNPN